MSRCQNFPPLRPAAGRRKGRRMARIYGWITSRLEGTSEESGQGTIEYVLVMLAVTAVAVVLISWAKSGEGKSLLGGLFGEVIGWIVGAAKKFRV